MGLIRSLFWLAIFLCSTFAFTVLFEHGPSNFSANAKKEYETISKLYGNKIEKKKDGGDALSR